MNYGKVAYLKATQLEKHFQNLYQITQKSAENTLNQKKEGQFIQGESWDFFFSCSKAGSVLVNCCLVSNCQEKLEIQHFFNGVYVDSTYMEQAQNVSNFCYTIKNALKGVNCYSVRFVSGNAYCSATVQLTGSFMEKNKEAIPFTCLNDTSVFGKLLSPVVYIEGEQTTTINLDGEISQCKLATIDGILHLFYLKNGQLIVRNLATDEEKYLATSISHFALADVGEQLILFLVVRNKVYRATVSYQGWTLQTQLVEIAQNEKAVKVFCTQNEVHKVLVVQSASRLSIFESSNWYDFSVLSRTQEKSATDVIVDGDQLKILSLKENLCQKIIFDLTSKEESAILPVRYLSGVCFRQSDQLLCSQFEKLSIYSI